MGGGEESSVWCGALALGGILESVVCVGEGVGGVGGEAAWVLELGSVRRRWKRPHQWTVREVMRRRGAGLGGVLGTMRCAGTMSLGVGVVLVMSRRTGTEARARRLR